jgi:hypothetical protein
MIGMKVPYDFPSKKLIEFDLYFSKQEEKNVA